MKSDPRNQAVLIHIDGWNPHSTLAKHSIANNNISMGQWEKLFKLMVKLVEFNHFYKLTNCVNNNLLV